MRQKRRHAVRAGESSTIWLQLGCRPIGAARPPATICAYLCRRQVAVQQRHRQKQRLLVQAEVDPDLHQPADSSRPHRGVQILMRLEGWPVLLVQVLGGRPAAGLGLVEMAASGNTDQTMSKTSTSDTECVTAGGPQSRGAAADRAMARLISARTAAAIDRAPNGPPRAKTWQALAGSFRQSPSPEHLRELVARRGAAVECCSKAGGQGRLAGAVLLLCRRLMQALGCHLALGRSG